MPLTRDIVESWKAPRRVIRRHQARARSESFLFALLFVFLLLAMVSVAPFLARQAVIEAKPLPPYILAACFGALVSVPVFYLLAAVGHLTAKLMGGTGGFYDGRLALFWALVTTTPALLLYGLVRAMAADSPATPFLGLGVFLIFLGFYSVMLREVESR
ncbi:hypothetical protein [Stagnihabitans tardus]|uniref:YIP1 family protein n=1 Tax=Stagnihabitans tardus TaxID=2699202 RepID=A0AAE4Y9J4_9RHOB|nr:hypothetical protein [Stagnihabitans tardus]NBZ85975.1 YIP1 family protein [Stagnihabitans tardus]